MSKWRATKLSFSNDFSIRFGQLRARHVPGTEGPRSDSENSLVTRPAKCSTSKDTRG